MPKLWLFLILCFGSPWMMRVWSDELETIQNYFKECNYERAYKALKKYLKTNPEDRNAQYLNIRLSFLTGEYSTLREQLEEIHKKDPADSTLSSALGELYLLIGEWEKADQILTETVTQFPKKIKALYLQASLAKIQGKESAAKQMRFFVDHWNKNAQELESAEDLFYTGLGIWDYCQLTDQMERFQVATQLVNKVFAKVVKMDPVYFGVLAQIKLAEVWLECFDTPNARKEGLYPALGHIREYNKNGDPKDTYHKPHPDGFVLLGLSYIQDGDSTKMEHFMEEALKYNPNHIDAQTFLAQLRISDERYDDAKKRIESVLLINPRSLYALSLQASLHYLLNEMDRFEEIKRRIFILNPKYGEFYLILTNCLQSKRQFEKSVQLLQEALKCNPFLASAYRELAVNLLWIGKEKEGLYAIQQFREFNKTDVMTWNMLGLFEKMDSFVTLETPHFVMRLDVSEKDVMIPYLEPFMEESYQFLKEKYQCNVSGPILLEVFTDHQDFSVRTVGFGGLGATGACFGKLVTIDSPKSRKPGEFNWASTAWHEFAHVITLQLSNYQVPRWFTEGLSEYEEHCRNPSWARDYELEFYIYWSKGQMRGMETFNEGFRVPWEIGLCYYQGGLMCRYIADVYGFSKILEMLKAYGEGKPTKEVIPAILGVDYPKFDQGFQSWLQKNVFTDMKLLPYFNSNQIEDFKDELDENPENMEVLAKLCIGYFQNQNFADAEINGGLVLQSDPQQKEILSVLGRIMQSKGRTKNAKQYLEQAIQQGYEEFFTYLTLAEIYQAEQNGSKAIELLKKAKACFPKYVGNNSPYLTLAKIYEQQGNKKSLLEELEAYCRIQGSDLNARIRMVKEYQEIKQNEKAIQILQEVHDIFPYQVESHTLLANIFKAQTKYESAIKELKIAIAVKPKEGLEVVHTDLADIYLTLKKTEEARSHLQISLQINPNYDRAKKLLESLDK
ncbi:MAG: tetratricopeptide repeat protein [Planctomycetota bacterium]